MNAIVRNKLIEVARKKGIIYYQELCDVCNLKLDMYNNPQDRLEIGYILGTLSEYEYKAGRPLLSAVVLSKSGEEGDGFYKLCQELGITSDWRRLKRDDTFAIIEINKCHDFWRNDDNYNNCK